MQKAEISWRIGGQQGEGIESSGEILGKVLNDMGYFLYAYRLFSSRIKGGHTHYTLRIADKQVGTLVDSLDVLVAFDPESITLSTNELNKTSVVLLDEAVNVDCPIGQVYKVPFSKLAQEHKLLRQKNVLAIAATVAVLNLDVDHCKDVLKATFADKGEEAIRENERAFALGYDYIKEQIPKAFAAAALQAKKDEPKLFMLGNEAISLGAISGGARFMAAYPITPASEIMEYLIEKLPEFGGMVVQTEDEIAACMMAIGANYAGARALTATSGPGLSLMAESIGLACMTETPVVIIDTQRGGPSTGLPTKNEQSDILAAIFNTHGDTAKIVLAPSSVEEAFYDAFEAFNLAEQYQCPVIMLTDLQLSLAKQSVAKIDLTGYEIERGNIAQGSLPELVQPEYFPRYRLDCPNGVSERALPGTKGGISLSTGLEHDIYGRPSEDKRMRNAQSIKRLQKMRHFLAKYDKALYIDAPHIIADVLLVGVNATRAVLSEVKDQLESEGLKVNHLQIRLLNPFPAQQTENYLIKAKKVIVFEHNATAQLASLIKMRVDNCPKLISVLQYDGNIITPQELYTKCKEVLA